MSGYVNPNENEMSPAGEAHSPGRSDNAICGLNRRNLVKLAIGILAVVIVITVVLLAVFIRMKPTGPGLIYEPNVGEGGIFLSGKKDLRRQDTDKYTKRLFDIIKDYDGGSESMASRRKNCQSGFHPDVSDDSFCIFKDNWLSDRCIKAEEFGYTRKSPCILLFFNKIENWVPDVYQSLEELPDSMPEDLRQHIQDVTEQNQGKVPEMVWVHCEGVFPADREYLGPLQYSPWRGFPAYYFPYRNDPAYMAPIVAVQVTVEESFLVRMECRAWAKNILHSREDGLGMVTIEILDDGF